MFLYLIKCCVDSDGNNPERNITFAFYILFPRKNNLCKLWLDMTFD